MKSENDNWKSGLTDVLYYYEIKPSPKAGKNFYVCPFCHSGEHDNKTGALSVYNKEKNWYCFSCGEYGDVLDLIGKMENIDNYKAKKHRLTEIIGRDPFNGGQTIMDSNFSSPQSVPTKALVPATDDKPKAEKVLEARQNLKLWHSNVGDTLPKTYLHRRGLSDETIKRFKLGYNSQNRSIVIPYFADKVYYAERLISPTNHKYEKPKRDNLGTEPIFNQEALQQTEPIFVCEGQFNAISIEQAGGHAIALGGAQGKNKLISELKKKKKQAPLIICFDADEPGKQASLELAADLVEIGQKYIVGQFSFEQNNCNDANDLLVANPRQLQKDIEANVQQAERARFSKYTELLDKAAEYIPSGWMKDFDKFSNMPPKKTGFDVIDEETNGLYPGLYVLGAISSLGKTTFVHQMANQMAAAGEHVLYFSLEQTEFELTNKSLSRLTALKYGTNNAISAIRIRTGAFSNTEQAVIRNAFQQYMTTIAGHMHIIKPSFANTKVETVCNTIEAYVKVYNQAPVVFIDYLQLLEAPEKLHLQDKQKTDYVVKKLKDLQSKYNLTMVAISSVNRANYLTPVDFESFKESGIIEYSADVVLGLQLGVLDNSEFFDGNNNKKLTKKREKVKEAKAANPRIIKLVCLKNRYGKTNFEDYFSYYPACDLFEENWEKLAEANEKNKPNKTLTV